MLGARHHSITGTGKPDRYNIPPYEGRSRKKARLANEMFYAQKTIIGTVADSKSELARKIRKIQKEEKQRQWVSWRLILKHFSVKDIHAQHMPFRVTLNPDKSAKMIVKLKTIPNILVIFFTKESRNNQEIPAFFHVSSPNKMLLSSAMQESVDGGKEMQDKIRRNGIIESGSKNVYRESIARCNGTAPAEARSSVQSFISNTSDHTTIHQLPSEKGSKTIEEFKGLDLVLLQRSSQVLYEKLFRGTKLFKTSATAIKDTVERLFDELDYMEENLRSLQSENNNASQPFLEERLRLLHKIAELEEKVTKDRIKFEKLKVNCKLKDTRIAMLQQRTIWLSVQKRRAFIRVAKLRAPLLRKWRGKRQKKSIPFKNTKHLRLVGNMPEQVNMETVKPAKSNWIVLLGLACSEVGVDACVSYLRKACHDAMPGNLPGFMAFEVRHEALGTGIKSCKTLTTIGKPERAAPNEWNALKDQQIQTDKIIFDIQITELRLLIAEKEKKIQEMEEKIRQCQIETSTLNADHTDHRITLEKETIAAEALSALHQTVIHDKPKVARFADDQVFAVNEVLEVDPRSRASSSESSNGSEGSVNEGPPVKYKKVRRPQKRNVKVAYFRWTTGRNLLLVSKMIEVMKEYGKNQLKESDFLQMVRERCEEISEAGKIRDNVNNLLRRHSHLSKMSISEVKSFPEEYTKLLEKIRDSLEKQGLESEKIKAYATADDEQYKNPDINKVSGLEEATSSEKPSAQTLSTVNTDCEKYECKMMIGTH